MRKAIAGQVICCALLSAAIGMGGEMAQAQAKSARNAVQDLDHGWQFRQITAAAQPSENGWLPATVPGDVHLDLLANKKISDPFFRDNEAKLQWIENEAWEYRVSFEVTPAMLARSHVDLVFDGLDATAEVYLNSTRVLDANNSFRIWRVPAKEHLHVGKNLLYVVFPSPIKAAAKVAAGDAFRLKSKTEDKTYVRKPAYEYGWDWGPRFVTSGIWKPVRLEAWDKLRIADFAIRQRDVNREVAHLNAEVEVEAAAAGSARVNARSMFQRSGGTSLLGSRPSRSSSQSRVAVRRCLPAVKDRRAFQMLSAASLTSSRAGAGRAPEGGFSSGIAFARA